MTGIMVLGHGHFASGIASAAELILGKQDDFVWVDFPEGDTKTELEAHIAEALQTMKEAEHILYSEFAHVLQIKPDEVLPFIMGQLDIQGDPADA